MEFLIDPNIAYIFLVAAVMLALMTIIVPGTGIPEIGMVVCLGVTWYELSRQEPNAWALIVVALSIVPFIVAIKQTRLRLPLLAAAVVMLSIGSVFLFTDAQGRPLVNFGLAGVVSTFSGLFVWFAVVRGLQVQGNRLINDPDSPVGVVGEARTAVFREGTVQVNGELWTARSDSPIPAGSFVRILKREGFVLTVKKTEKITK